MHTMNTHNENNTNILPSSNILHVVCLSDISNTSKHANKMEEKTSTCKSEILTIQQRSATESETKSTLPDF